MVEVHRLAARRLSAQLLSGAPARDPLSVVARLLAVQAQDGRGARLAIRARSSKLVAADVNRALTEERTLVISWLNRGTLHLVRSEDYAWLHALVTPRLKTAALSRLALRGVSRDAADRAVRTIHRALGGGPLTRMQLRERLASSDVLHDSEALIHLLFLANLEGSVLRGPMLGKQHAYVLREYWIPDVAAIDRESALAELARRYLAGHGPAGDRDLARWAGISLSESRRALRAITSEIDELDSGLVDIRGRRAVRSLPRPRLLGAFDPVLLGWASREFVTGPHVDAIVRGGMFLPFALVDGKVAAGWEIVAGSVRVLPLQPISARDTDALQADSGDVMRFLGST